MISQIHYLTTNFLMLLTTSFSTCLLFAVLNPSFLLAGEELSHLLVPAQRPLVDHGKVSRVCLESIINAAAEPLADTCQNQEHRSKHTNRLPRWIK